MGVMRVLTVLGTRPEVIKLAPVVRRLQQEPLVFQTTTVVSGQHADMLYPFAERFGLRIDRDLKVGRPNQTPSGVCARVLEALDGLLADEPFDAMLVQGDTTTALAAALAAFHRGVPVGHVEAGLRSGDPLSPFPEEMNRRLVTRLAAWHFAATEHNRRNLLLEGVPDERIFVTGNPVVDAVQQVSARAVPGAKLATVLEKAFGKRILAVTTHRRESFGLAMTSNMKVLRDFVSDRPDVVMVFPVHPNPIVVKAAQGILSGHDRIVLTEPLGYEDFLVLLSHAWLVASDSGGVQEEAPSLGKPVLVMRETTERPEGVTAGNAKLVGVQKKSS